MNPRQIAEDLKLKLRDMGLKTPSLHVVLGSGFGAAFEEMVPGDLWIHKGKIEFGTLSGFCETTVPGHQGRYSYFEHRTTGKIAAFQAGRFHGYEGHSAQDVVQTVMIPRLLGTERFVLTNAAGGLRKEMTAGSVMVIMDHVNLTGRNPLVGANPVGLDNLPLGPRFPDMSQVYDPAQAARMALALKTTNLAVHHGTYLGLLGPSFETPAEIRLFSQWGMDAVGMSTVWEAISLRHSGALVAGLSLISNLGCGLSSGPLNHEEILATSKKAASEILRGLLKFAEMEFHK